MKIHCLEGVHYKQTIDPQTKSFLQTGIFYDFLKGTRILPDLKPYQASWSNNRTAQLQELNKEEIAGNDNQHLKNHLKFFQVLKVCLPCSEGNKCFARFEN